MMVNQFDLLIVFLLSDDKANVFYFEKLEYLMN